MKLSDYKRTIQELAVRYELEPTLRDLYVEGRFDVRLFERFARELDLELSVYEIATVECTASHLAEMSLPDNCKSRVVWLAHKLSESLGHNADSIRCIADSDFDRLLDITWNCGLLLVTEYTSVEAYVFTEAMRCGIFADSIGLKVDHGKLQASLMPVLQKLFLIRAANVKLHWGIAWLPPKKCLNCSKNDDFEFDEDVFIDRYLNKGARFSQKDDFVSCIKQLEAKMCHVDWRAHDAFELLAMWLHARGVDSKFSDREVLEAMSLVYLQPQQLLKYTLFRIIADWTDPGQKRPTSVALAEQGVALG